MSKNSTKGTGLGLKFDTNRARVAYRQMIDSIDMVSDSDARMGAQLRRSHKATAPRGGNVKTRTR